MSRARLVIVALSMLSVGAAAADMLPLKHGIYVPTGSACKGASNAEMVNYWGGKSAIGAAQATCTIRKLVKQGTKYTFTDVCTDIQSGQSFEGQTTVLKIAGPTQFTMSGTTYRYCGPKPQW